MDCENARIQEVREREELIVSVSKRGVTEEDEIENERRVHGVLLRGRKRVKSFTGMKNGVKNCVRTSQTDYCVPAIVSPSASREFVIALDTG